MIYPRIFEMISDDPLIRGKFGRNPVRIYPFGYAPQNVSSLGPYAVWQTIGGTPANTLACPPTADDWSVQVDVYSPDVKIAREACATLVEALQEKCWITNWRGESRDFETKSFRISFDIQVLQKRS